MAALVNFFQKYDSIDQAPKQESMKVQLLRMSSFKAFPPHVRMSALKLAEAGFYYTGFQDETACFACNLRLQDWEEGLNPFEMHRRYSADCEFVNNNLESFPVGQSGPCKESFKLAYALSQQRGSANVIENMGGNNGTEGQFMNGEGLMRPPALQSDSEAFGNSATNQQSQDFLREELSVGDLASRANTQGTVVAEGMRTPHPPPGMFASSRSSNNNGSQSNWKKDYRYERSRLNSFRNWPSNAAIRPSDLAEAGFYYMGSDDRVQCVFCRGILRNWEPSDNAFSEHRRHFAQCQFLANPEDVGNVKLGRENFPVDELPGPVDPELNVHAAVSGEIRPPAEDYCRGIVKDKPIHSMYALPADRLQTFKNFPILTQTPEQFTRAGFFYSGISDNVKCFFCDGGLRNWEPNDDPWTEHGRWFPRCGYIRLCKGDEFIKEIQQRFAPPPDHKPARLRNTHRGKKHKIDPERLTKVVASRIVQSVVEMGWSTEIVQEVAKRRLEDLDDEFPNAESLLDALQDYETELKYVDTHGDSDNSQETNKENHEVTELESVKEGTKKKNKKKKNKKKKSGAAATSNAEKPEAGGDTETIQEEQVPHEPYQYMDDEEAKRLSEDIQRMKDERLCKVCMDDEVNIVFLRCGHLVCCSNCAPAMRHCPICRELIRGTVRVFLS